MSQLPWFCEPFEALQSLGVTPRSRTTVLRPLIRFVGAVLAVSGVLFVAAAVVTIAWQEPVSAFVAFREQDRLRAQLAETASPAAESRAGVGASEQDSTRRRAPGRGDARPVAELRPRATTGRPAGRIVFPTLRRDYVFVEGADGESLRRGPGHLGDTPLPGEGGTVGFAGHRTTYGAPFRNVDRLKAGDPIQVEMPYGAFTYRVRRTRTSSPTPCGSSARSARSR